MKRLITYLTIMAIGLTAIGLVDICYGLNQLLGG